jgi:alpha-N-acetylglucosamine transferase
MWLKTACIAAVVRIKHMVRMLLQVHVLLQSTLTVTLGWLQVSGFYVDRSSGLESYVG